MTEENSARDRGLEMMRRVYGWEMGEVQGAFLEATTDHLFGEVWHSGDMTIRDRRLFLMGMLVGSGDVDVLEIQFASALGLGEITPEEIRELVLLGAHYAGWPRGAKMNTIAETAIARHAKGASAQ